MKTVNMKITTVVKRGWKTRAYRPREEEYTAEEIIAMMRGTRIPSGFDSDGNPVAWDYIVCS